MYHVLYDMSESKSDMVKKTVNTTHYDMDQILKSQTKLKGTKIINFQYSICR